MENMISEANADVEEEEEVTEVSKTGSYQEEAV
ncbi:hypothetical protein QFZ78_000900 [Paenibacillus sp. V4I5]|nr:hypothetical protein [Paenibacillus sp. V4I5]